MKRSPSLKYWYEIIMNEVMQRVDEVFPAGCLHPHRSIGLSCLLLRPAGQVRDSFSLAADPEQAPLFLLMESGRGPSVVAS